MSNWIREEQEKNLKQAVGDEVWELLEILTTPPRMDKLPVSFSVCPMASAVPRPRGG